MIGDILQPTHLIFILVVALLVLGPKRLPEVGRSLGKGIRDFRGALSGIDEQHESHQSVPASPVPVTPAATAIPGAAPVASAAPAFEPERAAQPVATAVMDPPLAGQRVAVDAEPALPAESDAAVTEAHVVPAPDGASRDSLS